MTSRTDAQLVALIEELIKLPSETEWLEFKENNAKPEDIGEYISALSNSAALEGRSSAYVVWGVHDDSREVTGTSFDPARAKVSGEELENWLLKLLQPRIDFEFYPFQIGGKNVVLLEIGRAFRHPVQFQGTEFIRIGSYKKRLKDFPEKERAPWKVFEESPFEDAVAMKGLVASDALQLLDYATYFRLLDLPLPSDSQAILSALEGDELVKRALDGSWCIAASERSDPVPFSSAQGYPGDRVSGKQPNHRPS